MGGFDRAADAPSRWPDSSGPPCRIRRNGKIYRWIRKLEATFVPSDRRPALAIPAISVCPTRWCSSSVSTGRSRTKRWRTSFGNDSTARWTFSASGACGPSTQSSSAVAGDPPSGPEPTRLFDGDLEQGTGDVAESGATDEPATEESASAEEPSPPEPEGKDVATAATAEEDKVLQPPTFLAKPRKEVSAGLCPSCVWLSRSWSRPASRSGLRGTYHRAIGGSQRTAGLGWSQPRGDGRGRFDSAAPGKRQAYVLVGGMS